MRHVRLGRTGLSVSRLCLGTMTFGLQCDEPASVAILERAAAGGITFLDTADVYPVGGTFETVGRTEEILGRWLRGRRGDFVVATKCAGAMSAKPWDRGASRKHILDAIEGKGKGLANIEIAHRSSVLPLLGMLSWRLGRSINWDGAKEQIAGDPEANKLLSRPYRAPWIYPVG